MMMMWCRTRNLLPLHRVCSFANRVPSQDSIFLPTSTILPSKGPNFTTIFKRFSCVQPPPPPPPPIDDTPRSIMATLQWYFAKSFETVPYTNRTRRILYPRHLEKRRGEVDFNGFKERYQQNKEWLLSPTHPHTVRVKMILNKIIDALQKDLKIMGNSTSSFNSIVERILMTSSGKTPPATTSHLYGMGWDVFVVNDPALPDIPYCYCFTSEGKIVVNQCLVRQLADIDIAVPFAHQVACAVGRHKAEEMTKEMGISYLDNLLGETFAKHIGQKIISHIKQLPSNTRLNEEADYIGHQILVSAGYDPEKVVEVYKRMGRILM